MKYHSKQGNKESKHIEKIIQKNNITKETILGSKAMGTMIEELEGDTLIDKRVAKIFLQSLLKELNIPISKKLLVAEINAYFATKEEISKEQLKTIIFNKLPIGTRIIIKS